MYRNRHARSILNYTENYDIISNFQFGLGRGYGTGQTNEQSNRYCRYKFQKKICNLYRNEKLKVILINTIIMDNYHQRVYLFYGYRVHEKGLSDVDSNFMYIRVYIRQI